ncbi:MAG: DnaD domain protein [Chloroflexi bacterium]|jgi:DnaD/phage-associated family protein|nr:DnaD domain protein [Chloroflexota bacterium]
MGHHAAASFSGFPDNPESSIRLPLSFFTQTLGQIDDFNQLRLLLYIFWHAEQQPGQVHYFRWEDLCSDPTLIQMLSDEEGLSVALNSLLTQELVLKADIEWMAETYYFLNTPQGRAAVLAIENGVWHTTQQQHQPAHLPQQTPNIFQLYEENIGVMTPMLAEILKDDEKTYPPEWIREAIQIAVARNVRTWNYVQGILKRWHKEGYKNEQNRRHGSQDPEEYRRSWLKRD